MTCRYLKYTCIVLFSSLLISCGDDDDTPTGNGRTNPVIVSTSPVNGATGVAVDVSITATFSEDMDLSTITPATFLISHGVTGSVTYANRVATFTPFADLMEDTTYTATITTGVKGVSGKSMLSNFVWVFTVEGNGEIAFSTEDLEGLWDFRGLGVGYSEADNFWAIGQISISANGIVAHLESDYSDGRISTPFAGMNMALDSTGILTAAPSDLHGIMDSAKSMIVVTGTDIIGRLDLIVLIKRGGAIYSPDDLNGTWDFHTLVSGWPPDFIGWAYAIFEVTSDSISAFTSIHRSNGDNSVPSPGKVYITNDGFVSVPNMEFRGVMDPHKDIIVVSSTDPGGGGKALLILTKRSATTFNISDMDGQWITHGLTSGEIGDYKGWGYAYSSIDGNGLATYDSIMRWDGDDSVYTGPININLSSDGITTIPGTDYHGILTARKDKWIGVMSDGGGGYNFGVAVKR